MGTVAVPETEGNLIVPGKCPCFNPKYPVSHCTCRSMYSEKLDISGIFPDIRTCTSSFKGRGGRIFGGNGTVNNLGIIWFIVSKYPYLCYFFLEGQSQL